MKNRKANKCCDCGKEIYAVSERCGRCAAIARWSTPEYREAASAGVKKMWTPEHRKRMSELWKEKWTQQDFYDAATSGMRRRPKRQPNLCPVCGKELRGYKAKHCVKHAALLRRKP